MNVFVLNTGRCGSTTFIQACRHIKNYTSAHESRSGLLGQAHFDYPENHIEADNRLSWFLGRLDRRYGDEAFYVHLRRDDLETARSFERRFGFRRGIIAAYRSNLHIGLDESTPPLEICLDYCDTVNSNIELFLKDKTRKMEFRLERAADDFRRFWEQISAEGDLEAALREFAIPHNASVLKAEVAKPPRSTLPIRAVQKCGRIVAKLPEFLKRA